ncbi:LPS O-antigen chain length determinant protein WzzB [Serratia odorifera]|uniref:Chain length determinant protein n=1 Tax=Serratia odorifera DSM 4582 TaxID=667129 RepID=D4E8P1_SEROD|nr:LPS O-antigen chain length determinant protein WzzB [Serratia odorifera]EFE93657.1 chain length determinant protein [Serratia odorifera DSM 4582]MBJ2064016.1 LPS O-antigen chain length determinant protein WzzB [Serratia odorifera]PNK88719.1 LPS O-antigen chain length determinant protein WzzB [Serratia odorifera]RII69486.1 LPS O-antigen chain length determinant protein WzzB [Serratia odorifera]HEJ9095198.1 LPS O-antigen chain length determinant protein WzzB [Serratia odorifera]
MTFENKPLASSRGDDFSLIGVVLQLWQGKKTIIISIIVTLILGGIYLAVAKQQWTSEAVVSRPTAGQLANYNTAQNIIFTSSPQDKTSIPALQELLFNRFNGTMTSLSMSLQRMKTPLKLNVNPLVSGSNDPLRISFTATSAAEAQKKLQVYIDNVNRVVVNGAKDDIKSTLVVKKKELNETLAAQLGVAEEKKNQRLKVLREAVKVATAAKIQEPKVQMSEDLSDDSLFLLGAPALNSLLANESTRPLALDREYYETQRALIALNNYEENLDGLSAYRYIQRPDLPELRDSPKRALTILLALIVGLIVGSAIVILRNAVKDLKRTS